MKNKFDFYEIVKVISPEKIYSKIYGSEGVIMGMSQNDDGSWGYAVSVNATAWDVDEKYLLKTGRFSKHEDFYDDKNRVTIIVDKDGKGEIKE